ncbi:MAG: UDP-N-acetylmuramoyl-tripeptide--D-alanyl-D-alanine ligase [Microgenomates group bacterium]
MEKKKNWKQIFHFTRRILAKTWLKFFPHLTIIGITGSYGKTNTTRAITEVLSQKAPTLQTDINLDTIYNLPITILKLRPKHRYLVLEYGVDHKNEMDFHLSLVKPHIGVITGINPTHSDPELLGSLEGIVSEKSKLLKALSKTGWAILNKDDIRVLPMAKVTQAKVIWYGTSPKADYWAENIKVNFSGTEFTLCHQKERIKIITGLIGRHFVHACLVGAIVGRLVGLDWELIKKGLKNLKPLKGRLSVEKGPLETILIDDHLRANPASTQAGLETLSELPTKGKRVAVLGEMGELGVMAEKEHREIGKKIAQLKNIDYFLGIGPLQKLAVKEAEKLGKDKNQLFWAKDVLEAGEILKKILKKGDLFYLKGSLLRHTERILLILEGKKVGCRVTSCHFYWQCQNCPYLQKGFK